MNKRTAALIVTAIIIAIVVFNVLAIGKISRKTVTAASPSLNDMSRALYGKIEPAGKAIHVSPWTSGVVHRLYVKEGMHVRDEQLLCTLKSSMQGSGREIVSLQAPCDGIIYRCDLREGEAFQVNDRDRLVLGAPELQVCCDVDLLWVGKVDRKKLYVVLNAENYEEIGTASYRSASRYLRPKSLRSEDPGEKLSTNYQEIIFDFQPHRRDLPISLPVIVKVPDIPPVQAPSPSSLMP